MSGGFRSNNIVVIVQPLSEKEEWKITGRELVNLLMGMAVAFDLHEIDEELQIRFVLKPSSYREGFEKFLKVRAERECLDAAFLRRKEGSVVVEVADEKAKRWVEVGKAALPEEQRRLVSVEVGGEKGWERWVGYKD